MMKKWMTVLLVGVVLSGMVGCVGENKQPIPETTTQLASQTATQSVPETTTGIEDEVSNEFKEAMDDYEEYFNAYVALMEKYKANPNDMSILEDYTAFMSSYAEMIEKMEKIGDQELTPDELSYYLEVTTRIYHNLSAVAGE